MHYKKMIVLGDDPRNKYLIRRMLKTNYDPIDGKNCSTSDLKKEISFCDGVILPPNFLGNETIDTQEPLKVNWIIDSMPANSTFFCGRASDDQKKQLYKRNIALHEFSKDEKFLDANAFLTAEAALAVAIKSTPRSLRNASILIAGSGRIAKYLVMLLKPFSKDIRLLARNPKARKRFSKQAIRTFSMEELHTAIFGVDAVFNTVPSFIFTSKELRLLPENAVYLELASKPYGCNKKEIPPHVIYQLCGGLPGAMSPDTAALAMFEALERITNLERKEGLFI